MSAEVQRGTENGLRFITFVMTVDKPVSIIIIIILGDNRRHLGGMWYR